MSETQSCIYNIINIMINNCDDNTNTVTTLYVITDPKNLKKSKNALLKRLNIENYYKCKTENVHCTICFEDIKSSQFIRKLPCKHKFHKRCIDNWLYISMNESEEIQCPLCRKKIEWFY